MLSSIRLVDFKGHEDTTVTLKPFTVLVGPNGSGKTSVLQAIHLMGKATQPYITKGPIPAFSGPFAPQEMTRRSQDQGYLEVESNGQPPWAFTISWSKAGDRPPWEP